MSKPLTSQILVAAYSQGYFPMPDERTDEMMWFRPDPRAIIPIEGFHVSKSLRKVINRKTFEVTFDKNFEQIINSCADRPETWINQEIKDSYCKLHREGIAHSVEVWHDGKIAGGAYGLALQSGFFAESMFHTVTNASKIALFSLLEHLKLRNYQLFECQFMTEHLASLGAVEISDDLYTKRLEKAMLTHCRFDS